METLRNDLEAIERSIETETNEHRLLESVREGLASLRVRYEADPAEFGDELGARLHAALRVEASVGWFVALKEELELVAVPQDAHDLRKRLGVIARGLSGVPIQKRVRREMRALWHRLPELEARVEQTARDALTMAKHRFERDAPDCDRCGRAMLIRESRYGLFWGCRLYPRCFGRRPLTKSQKSQLPEVETARSR